MSEDAGIVFIDGPPRAGAMFTVTKSAILWTSDLGEYARLVGRKWADDEAAAGSLMFHPNAVAAGARLDAFVAQLRRAMAEQMAVAALARRDELVAEHGAAATIAETEEATAASEAARAEQAKAHTEWLDRAAKASEEKRASAAPPPAPPETAALKPTPATSSFGADARAKRRIRTTTTPTE